MIMIEIMKFSFQNILLLILWRPPSHFCSTAWQLCAHARHILKVVADAMDRSTSSAYSQSHKRFKIEWWLWRDRPHSLLLLLCHQNRYLILRHDHHESVLVSILEFLDLVLPTNHCDPDPSASTIYLPTICSADAPVKNHRSTRLFLVPSKATSVLYTKYSSP